MKEFILQQHNGVTVVRDDLLQGGSKTRFLPYLLAGQKEVVFGAPFCGGAPLALSYVGKEMGIQVTIFYAKRNELHPYQRKVLENGGRIFNVPMGWMSNVQKKARDYAQAQGALFLPLGFDVPAAAEPFIAEIKRVREQVGKVDEVWCATGSGMLARCIGVAFPEAIIHGVIVGLKSRNEKQNFGDNVTLHDCAYDFAQETKFATPFNSNKNYDAKAWEVMMNSDRAGKKILFWNVL